MNNCCQFVTITAIVVETCKSVIYSPLLGRVRVTIVLSASDAHSRKINAKI